MRVTVQVIDASRGKRTAAPDDTVNGVPPGDQQLGQVGAILSGDARDKRDFVHG
jgi:hypothetical protein